MKKIIALLLVLAMAFGLVACGGGEAAADGGEIAIKANRSAYTLVSNIQEEVHRFAIGYHRKTRSKNTNVLKLCEIEGVGEATAKKLLSNFKSIKKLSAASKEEITKLGIPQKTAENIVECFKSN